MQKRETDRRQDAEAVIETYDSLFDKFSDQIERRAFASVRRALTLRQKKVIEEAGDLDEQLEGIRNRMEKAAERMADWKLELDGFDAIEGGVLSTYRQGAQDNDCGLR